MAEVISMADIEASAMRLGVDFSQVDLDSIRLPPGEDFGIMSDDDYLYEEDKCEPEAGFENIIVVDNLPVVPLEKFERLEGVIRKIYSQIGLIKENGLWMPLNTGTQKTLGYCFIEYHTRQEAELAKEKTNGYKLDKGHIFAVNLLDDFERLIMKVSDEWAAPETVPYSSGENLQHWLVDEKARDQYFIRAGSDIEILWNDPRQLRAELVYQYPYVSYQTDQIWISFSVLHGEFCAVVPTWHILGHSSQEGHCCLGRCHNLKFLMHYAHPQVSLIDFSPGEKYLVTYSNHEPSNPRDMHRVVLNIFDVRTGKLMRIFKGSWEDFATGGIPEVSWPIFRWCAGKNDKYFARIGKNVISVYETESFTLIEKKSLKVENVMDCSWSPADSILALFVPELGGGNQPAKMSLVQIPSKEELRQKNLFNVNDCQMYWQCKGDYLAVKVDRYTKTKKSTYTGFELFRIRERDIPIESLELDNRNDQVIAFAWEPKGHRFAVIHGDNPRPDISFYSMQSNSNTGRISRLMTLKGKQANALYWSPAGHFIILAGLKGLNGQLEFYNVDALETMAMAEHFMATYIEWDPTGRYVATSVTSVHEMENGFHIWSFNGKLLYRIPRDHFLQFWGLAFLLILQFSWRPRPLSFLSAEKEEEIAMDLKKYSKKYETEDEGLSMLLSEQDREKRKMLQEEWDRRVTEWKQLHEEEKAYRQMLRDGEVSDAEEEYDEAKEVKVEEVLDVEEVLTTQE
ncbi:hypothetical protein HHK36_028156 [Tetracentron sinense]|uniref:Eukaryotic translation initiation factor 3 subunit B n=1 Tax=Tetracentron sinense TaxID=13715 RepID=A0A835D467_TETSI|nr:hypothetical protein HHK36_028156 [Tetracentron sinense]